MDRSKGRVFKQGVMGSFLLAPLVFVAGAALSVGLGIWTWQDIDRSAELEFRRNADRVTAGVSSHLTRPFYGLNGLKAMFAVNPHVTRADFRNFVAARDLPKEFPGVRGFGFIQRVERANLKTFIAAERADGAPEFGIKPLTDTVFDDLYVVKFISPAAANQGAMGVDSGSEPTRRDAVLQAIDSGEPVVSRSINLVQNAQNTAGLILLVPVYTAGAQHTNPAERRAALVGVLYAPVVVAEMLGNLATLETDRLDFELFDAPLDDPKVFLLFDADSDSNKRAHLIDVPANRRYVSTLPLQMPGREFAIRVTSTSASDALIDKRQPWQVAAAGLLISGLLALLLYQQTRRSGHAERRARLLGSERDVLTQIVQHTENAVSVADKQGRITWVNAGFERMTGYAANEVIGKTPGELLACPEADAQVLRVLSEAAASFTRCRVEILNRAKDGHLFWVDTEVQPRFNAQGEPTGFIEIGTEITARKASEAALRSQQALLESIVENVPVGLSAFDKDLNLIAHNRQFQTDLDLPDALFSGPLTTFESIIAFNARRGEYGNGDPDTIVQAIMERTHARVPHRLERVRPNGVTLAVRGAPMPEGGFVTTYADISEQKRAAKAIRDSDLLLRGALDAIDKAFALYDAQDRLVFCNEKYSSLFGDAHASVVPGARFEDLIRHTTDQRMYAALHESTDANDWLAQRMAAHRAGNGTLVQTLADGRVLHIVERRLPDGQTVCFILDVSDLVHATEAAQSANLAKSQFLANMSHEIRTPMNGVLGVLQVLKGTELSTRQQDFLSKADTAARSLLRILNDVLDFSKVEAGKMELDPEPFKLADVAHELEAILLANRGSKPITLRMELDPTLPEVLIADAGRLKQVLLNLGSNAIKFTAQGEVTMRVLVRGRDQHTVSLGFEVVDTGIGLSPEQQQRVFKGFSQAETSTSRRFGGTGLGLTISQGMVELLGGTLQVRSALGAGSTFYFDLTLPIGTAQPPAAAETPAAVRHLDGLRILLVEDNPINQLVAKTLLLREGALVTLAENGQLAIDALQASPDGFDAVLMDVQMPVMDGLEATRHIRQELKLTQIPILAMTANALASDREDCLQAGMNDHIGKPFKIQNLLAMLVRHAIIKKA